MLLIFLFKINDVKKLARFFRTIYSESIEKLSFNNILKGVT